MYLSLEETKLVIIYAISFLVCFAIILMLVKVQEWYDE